MRKILLTITFFIAYAATAFAQADRFKVSASYLNTEFQANPLEAIEYLGGYSVDADGKIYGKGGFRVGGVFSYQKVYNQVVVHDYLGMEGNDIQRNVNTLALGVALSYRAGPVEPFGAFLLGARRPHEDLDYEVVRKYRVGADLPFTKESHFFLRPFFVEFEVTGGFNGYRTHKYGAGAGLRF
jgi:hypothetical protein